MWSSFEHAVYRATPREFRLEPIAPLQLYEKPVKHREAEIMQKMIDSGTRNENVVWANMGTGEALTSDGMPVNVRLKDGSIARSHTRAARIARRPYDDLQREVTGNLPLRRLVMPYFGMNAFQYFDQSADNMVHYDTFRTHMMSALTYLHGLGIAHCDVKPDNIYFDNGLFKLADFDLSLAFDVHSSHLYDSGTSIYMSPETTSEQGKFRIQRTFNDYQKADYFALGVTCYCIQNTKSPVIWYGIGMTPVRLALTQVHRTYLGQGKTSIVTPDYITTFINVNCIAKIRETYEQKKLKEDQLKLMDMAHWFGSEDNWHITAITRLEFARENILHVATKLFPSA